MNFIHPKPEFSTPIEEAIFAAKVYGYTEEGELADFLYGAYFADYVEFVTCGELPDDYPGNCHLCYSDSYADGLYFRQAISAFAKQEDVQEQLDESLLSDKHSAYQEFVELIRYFRGLENLTIKEEANGCYQA